MGDNSLTSSLWLFVQERTLKSVHPHIPTAIPTDSKLCCLVSCYANPRDSDTKMWCILWIYMNISYIIFIWVCFCPMSYAIVYSLILCVCNNKQFVEKVYNFFAHVTIMVLLAIASWLSIGWPFLTSISIASIRWHYGLYRQYALICFPLSYLPGT